MLKLKDGDESFISFLHKITEEKNPRYYSTKQLSKEMNKQFPSKKIAYYFAHWSDLNISDIEIQEYAQHGTCAIWRIEHV